MSLFALLTLSAVALAGPPAPSTSNTPTEPSTTEDCSELEDEDEKAACVEKNVVEEVEETVEEVPTNTEALKGAKSPALRGPRATRTGE